jgi:hypothetical protein
MRIRFISITLLALIILSGVSCKKDNPLDTFTLQTLTNDGIDMNGTVGATNISSNPTIVAVFSACIDPETANRFTITLTRDYDNAIIPVTITAMDSTIIIVPNEILAMVTRYNLKFGAGLKSVGGQEFTSIIKSFTTQGYVPPYGSIAHWNFENNAVDQIGTYDASAVIDITYSASRNSAAGNCANFNGTTSIIEIPFADPLMNTQNFTISFWVKALSQEKGHFVFGLGAFYGMQFEIASDFTNCKFASAYSYAGGSDTAIFTDNWWNGDGKNKDNGGWQGWTLNKDMTGSGGIPSLLKDTWAHVVCTYNSTTRVGTMYMNGEAVKAQDFNLWPATDKWVKATGMMYGGKEPDVVNELAFGFIQSRAGTMWDTEPWGGYAVQGANHFKGQLDDVRIFNKAITAAEVDLMYKSEKL